MSKGVLIQASFYEAMQYLPDADRLQLYDGICAYTLKGLLPENLSPIAKSMFILMKPNIDSSTKKYTASVTNGKKGGKKTETQDEPSVNPAATQEEPSINPEVTQEEPSDNLDITQEEPSMNLDITQDEPSENQKPNQSNNQSCNQTPNQCPNQKPNHDYDYDLDYDLDYDYDLDSDLDSDSQRSAALAASPKSPKKKIVRHQYGEYKNVLLSDEEAEKLSKELPDWLTLVERLSEYMASSGKHYKSHYATLRAWNRREPKNKKPPQQYPEDDLSGIL